MIKHNIIYTSYSPWKFNMSKAQDSFIWDDSGKKHIDFTSGWNVTNLGWNQQEIIEAGIEQMSKNTYTPMWLSEDIQIEYANNLTKAIGGKLNTVARGTGGMEVIEMSIKLARSYTGKKKILSFYEQFHGSSIDALSLGYKDEWIEKITDPQSDFEKLGYPQMYRTNETEEEILKSFEAELDEKLSSGQFAAIVTEAGIITGWGSTNIAPEKFINSVRKITKKHSVLLLLDEIGTGFSRLGSLFAMHKFEVEPDIVVFAKAIANGSSTISALVTTKEIAEKGHEAANLQSTFAWNPVACAMANKTLEIHLRDKVWEMAEKKGKYIKEKLSSHLNKNNLVGDIRGYGMEIGIDLVKEKNTKEKNTELVETIVKQAHEKGLHIVCDHESNIQLMPPLTIKQDILDEGLDILINLISK